MYSVFTRASTEMKLPKSISVKRCHGLGNVVLLLPVLDHLFASGSKIHLVTNEKWIKTFSALRPNFEITSTIKPETIDLDEMTSQILPNQHRTDELAHLLGLNSSIASPRISMPLDYSKSFVYLRGSIVFAPEATHPSRQWPTGYCCQLKGLFPEDKLVIIGIRKDSSIPCDVDLRGQLETEDLFEVVSVAKTVITMDSAVLHIAASMRKPTVAIFGGIDIKYRIRDDQPVIVLQSNMICCPCNKKETCEGRYDCIKSIKPVHVFQAVRQAEHVEKLEVF